MSGWEVGDLALCLGSDDDGYWYDVDENPTPGPKYNEICQVTAAFINPSDGLLALSFSEYPNPEGYLPSFRKLENVLALA